MIKQAQPSFSFEIFRKLLLQNWKKAAIYGFLSIVIAFNLCIFWGSDMHSPGSEKTATAIQLSCFVLMGIINAWLFYKRGFLSELSLYAAKLAFICLLFVAMALVLFVYYYVSAKQVLIMAFASSSAFLFPFLICHCWAAFIAIPEKKYPVWYLPENETPLIISNNSQVQVQLTLARKANDDQTYTYPVTTSSKLKLGKVFETFVFANAKQENKNGIQLKDTSQHFFGWQFYEEKAGGLYKRWLNPSANLIVNKIKPNAKILVVRIDEDC